MWAKRTWIAVAAALAILLAVAFAIARFWNALGASEISLAGWLAMSFGVVVSVALGIGLMALMFFSSRSGYDDSSRHDC